MYSIKFLSIGTKNGVLLAIISCAFLMLSAPVSAGIIKIQDEKGCDIIGLDDFDSVQGSVHCDTGDIGFSLQALLNGEIGLFVGDSETPSWNIFNDTGSIVSSLPLYYSGLLAPNADIDMQVSGNWFDACVSDDGVHINSDASCGSGDKTVKPEDGGLLPVLLTWSGGDGIGIEETFNIGTSSFAHSGQDAGCISGTRDCSPAVIPVPAAVWLFGSAIAGFAGFNRFKKKS